MREAQELSQPTAEYHAQPVDDNLYYSLTCLCFLFVFVIVFFSPTRFEWHFTVRGPADSDFEGGIYHGRISLPPEYPLKPPSIMLLTVSVSLEHPVCLIFDTFSSVLLLLKLVLVNTNLVHPSVTNIMGFAILLYLDMFK